MRYVLRADASQSIGAGHVMRSSAIAEELIARGEEVIFVGEISDLPWVKERITSLGFSRIYNQSSDYISRPESDVLILDTYKSELNDPFIDSENWLHIVAIVDELTPNYRCTLRIHPGLDSDWTGNSLIPILAGPKYIPFRSSLSRDINVRIDKKHVIKIAVVAGGSDPYRLVYEIWKILSKFPEDFEVFLFSNESFSENLDSRFHYVEIGLQLDDLIPDMDLIFTTASTTSLEFIARGMCIGVVCSTDNQKQYYSAVGKLGVAEQIGIRNLDNSWDLDHAKMRALITSSDLRESFASKSRNLIDFDGASRLVEKILNL
jgi:spore coat polysaccharide biosynthesis predicted glycosyltransferase SpsG